MVNYEKLCKAEQELWNSIRQDKGRQEAWQHGRTISGKHPILLGSSKITCYPKNIKHKN
jgi:hypothetical protein